MTHLHAKMGHRKIHTFNGLARKAHEMDILSTLCFKTGNDTEGKKKNCKINPEIQALKTKINSEKKNLTVSLGTTVRISIPDVDKGLGNSHNVSSCNKCDRNCFYQLELLKELKRKCVRDQNSL